MHEARPTELCPSNTPRDGKQSSRKLFAFLVIGAVVYDNMMLILCDKSLIWKTCLLDRVHGQRVQAALSAQEAANLSSKLLQVALPGKPDGECPHSEGLAKADSRTAHQTGERAASRKVNPNDVGYLLQTVRGNGDRKPGRRRSHTCRLCSRRRDRDAGAPHSRRVAVGHPALPAERVLHGQLLLQLHHLPLQPPAPPPRR
jgi:hypothetical protein